MQTKSHLTYCDYISHLIRTHLLPLDSESLLEEVGPIKIDKYRDGSFRSALKTIDVLDVNGKSYRITIQEL